MRILAFTIDLDRDCNTAVRGETAAASRSCGVTTDPCHDASSQGMEVIADMLRSMAFPATIFAEGDSLRMLADPSVLKGLEIACHGMEHEDLTGESTGMLLENDQLEDIISRSWDTVVSVTGDVPRGFRAPYLNIDPRVLALVKERGFTYDSSMTEKVLDGVLMPKFLPQGMWEFPLARDTDSDGKVIDSYLWAMHEGRRPESDYMRMIDRFQEGVLVMATHSWHVMEGVREGPKGSKQAAEEADAIARMLGHARDSGFELLPLAAVEDLLNEDR